MALLPYDRERAVSYARRWALGRNPLFYDFMGIGGDCTNFISQCLYAGSCAMDFAGDLGWYYISPDDRAPAWSGVKYLFNYLTRSVGTPGPVGEEASIDLLRPGDLVQLGRADGSFYHTLIITGYSRGTYLVCAHSYDALDRPLRSYSFERLRGISITGVRRAEPCRSCFRPLYDGRELVIC